MKNLRKYALFLGLLGFLSFNTTSCKTGEGCENAQYQTGEELENFKGKRGKSGLFSKKEKKRMGK